MNANMSTQLIYYILTTYAWDLVRGTTCPNDDNDNGEGYRE